MYGIMSRWRRRARATLRRRPRVVLTSILPVTVLAVSTGCAAAVGAALAAGEIGRGISGLQQLLSSTREAPMAEIRIEPTLVSPFAGTYRGYQALDGDTVRFYVRTAQHPLAPIVDEAGVVTGYALHGIAAASLDTLEARVAALAADGDDRPGGGTIFFIEGTQPPNPAGRTLFPAAFMGRVAPGESRAADRQHTELRRLDLEMDAPEFAELAGQAIPHELFGLVAEGVFTVRADGHAIYRQEYEVDEGRVLTLHFERISGTTLP